MASSKQENTVVKITQKIVGYSIVDKAQEEPKELETKQVMHEGIARSEVLLGATYKIKPQNMDHAIYVTINDYVLNAGTVDEERHPYEIFINSKNMEHFQWVLALTRVISAVFRKGGDIEFLVAELTSVFDPNGGYWKQIPGKPSVYMPSLIADLGHIIKTHLMNNGKVKSDEPSEELKALLDEKKVEAEQSGALKNATMCSKCNTNSVVIMDGCKTCLNCGDSKCG